MKEHVYIFGAPMVQSFLDETKTQTRRKPSPRNCLIDGKGRQKWPELDWARAEISTNGIDWDDYGIEADDGHSMVVPEIGTNTYHLFTPRAKSGDLMWVKETWAVGKGYDGCRKLNPAIAEIVLKWYRTDSDDTRRGRWRSARYMPRWMSQIERLIKDVRFEFIQDISREDAVAEGIRPVTKDGMLTKYCIYDRRDHSSIPWQDMSTSPIPVFRELWDSMKFRRGWGWELNFPVLRISF